MKKKKCIKKKADIFYSDLKKLSLITKENPKMDVLSFDYQQICLSLTYHVATFFTRDKFSLITFVYIRQKKNKAYFFMYDESIAKKGQNEVISFIHYYLENLLQQGVKTLYLFSDNCSSQNKNNALIQYLYSCNTV